MSLKSNSKPLNEKGTIPVKVWIDEKGFHIKPISNKNKKQ